MVKVISSIFKDTTGKRRVSYLTWLDWGSADGRFLAVEVPLNWSLASKSSLGPLILSRRCIKECLRWKPPFPLGVLRLTVHPRLMGFSGFGWGRRVCPGVKLTESELLVACGSLISFFELLPNVDPVTGEKIWPDRENRNSNVIGGPTHFDIDLRVRDGRAEEIRRMYEEIECEE